MKIAIDIRAAAGEKTGKGWYTFLMVHELLKNDTENEYILYTRNRVPGFEQYKNAQVKAVKSKSILWHLTVAFDVSKENVDIFWAPTSYITPSFISKRIRTVITVHDLVAFLFPQKHNFKATLIEKICLKRAAKRASKIITVSSNTASDLQDKFQTPSKKIEVIPCAGNEAYKKINHQELTAFAKKTNLPKKFFLAVGTIEPRKNYKKLIEAFSIISERNPDYNLIIVGKNGWQFEEVYEEIQQKYLQKKVHILGYLSGKSLVNLYNLAEAFVFPSVYEGFGIPPLEAMMCGCPVVASYSSSIPEVVGDSALLIDPKSAESIASAMLKIIKDEELAEKLTNKGLQQAKKFSWEKSSKELLNIFKSL
ncbi:glycosyltransferase family 4 protein [Candidatus Peregrinibacteria bacterium]|jgi:glycosyltransferase involved in cell wall biosynthesis|nr:glycosyltransferase family 4 protein [Candidatus Peregrinibacteria bacterium]MBT7736510.1 glycosyltransferase family 4 protein [Candidatus Peregrinibacteria bacterium]